MAVRLTKSLIYEELRNGIRPERFAVRRRARARTRRRGLDHERPRPIAARSSEERNAVHTEGFVPLRAGVGARTDHRSRAAPHPPPYWPPLTAASCGRPTADPPRSASASESPA